VIAAYPNFFPVCHYTQEQAHPKANGSSIPSTETEEEEKEDHGGSTSGGGCV
jgi:hypothetical protein